VDADQKSFAFLNTFDVLHERGHDDWLEVYRQTPRPLDTTPDAGLTWDKWSRGTWRCSTKAPSALKDRFFADADWLDHTVCPFLCRTFPTASLWRPARHAPVLERSRTWQPRAA